MNTMMLYTAMQRATRAMGTIALLALGGVAGCDGGEIAGCPAQVTFEGPVLYVTLQRGGAAPASAFTIRDVTINGIAVSATSLVEGVPKASATVASNGTLSCGATCGFGISSGTYQFTLVAPGTPDARVTVDARYRTNVRKGCRNAWRDGTVVVVML